MNDSDENRDISALIRSVEKGEQTATTELWAHCYPRLLLYAKRKLPEHLRRILDEEDVALSAFKSFCFRAKDGTLGEIAGREELWRLLFCITSRKAQGYVRHQTRKKRGGGQVGGESTFKMGDHSNHGIDQVAGQVHSPLSLQEFEGQCKDMFDMLDDDLLQTIALLRVEGYSVDEIAERLDCAKRSVERRLKLIRSIWASQLETD